MKTQKSTKNQTKTILSAVTVEQTGNKLELYIRTENGRYFGFSAKILKRN